MNPHRFPSPHPALRSSLVLTLQRLSPGTALLAVILSFTAASALAAVETPRVELPDPLRFADGRPVTTTAAWEERRKELIALYEQHVFGRTPIAPRPPTFDVLTDKAGARGGLARRREVRIYLLGDKAGPWMDLLLYTPTGATGKVPAFVGLNYLGNQSVTEEPDVRITTSWITQSRGVPGVVDNRATEENRAAQARRWPLDLILKRGYAVATACYHEIEPDRRDGWRTPLREGLSAARDESDPSSPGAIALWAFGLSRALDYLQTVDEIDRTRIALTGHSRLGKTALWAAALDQRFALVVSNNSGEGGAALARRKVGERIADSIRMVAYWYAPRYADYVDKEEQLPVDAHLLVALSAPRPVYISSATQDLWADPEGEYLAGYHAGPVFALYGQSGLESPTMPDPDRRVGRWIGYHARTGVHDILEADWRHHLDFADQVFRR